ncbi:MAG: hypothetical protein JKX85_04060 [Phycisphaeraceae bacterium]|nr:hypothetical protein [Phycisphaeraceae bacterium]
MIQALLEPLAYLAPSVPKPQQAIADGFSRVGFSVMRLAAVLLAFAFAGLFTPSASAQNAVAHQQFVFAYRLLQREEYKLSMQAFDEYLARFPGDEKKGDALYYRGLLDRNVGHNVTAIGYLEQNVAPLHVPDHAVLFLKGQIYSDLEQHQKAVGALEAIDMQTLDSDTKASIFICVARVIAGLITCPLQRLN